MLVIHPAFYLLFNVLCRDPQRWLRSNRLLNRTVLCKPVGDFVSSHPSMSRNPIQCHWVLGGGIIQCLLTSSYQWRRYVSSLNGFQSRLIIKANTNIFLWPNVCLNFINTGQDSMFYREILRHLPKDFPQTPALVPSVVLDPSGNQMSPLTKGVTDPLVHPSLVGIVTLYLHSRLKAGYITSNMREMWDLTSEAGSVCCCVLDWCEGRTSVADSRDHAPLLTSPHLESQNLVEGGH